MFCIKKYQVIVTVGYETKITFKHITNTIILLHALPVKLAMEQNLHPCQSGKTDSKSVSLNPVKGPCCFLEQEITLIA